MTRIAIDLNVRVRGNLTYSGFEDIDGDLPLPGMDVEVYEPESGMVGVGRVADLDEEHRLVYLQVDWAGLRLPTATTVPGNGVLVQIAQTQYVGSRLAVPARVGTLAVRDAHPLTA